MPQVLTPHYVSNSQELRSSRVFETMRTETKDLKEISQSPLALIRVKGLPAKSNIPHHTTVVSGKRIQKAEMLNILMRR